MPTDTNTSGLLDTYAEVAGWGLTDSHAEDLAEVLQTVKVFVNFMIDLFF